MALKSRIGPVTQVQVVLPSGLGAAGVQAPEAMSVNPAGAVTRSIKTLYGVATRTEHVEQELFFRQLARALENQKTHPAIHGLCAALLLLGDHLTEEELLRQVKRHLAPGTPPLHGAAFVEGLLSLNRIVILRNTAIVRQLDTYLRAMSLGEFVHTLPALRRAASELSRAEIEYLIGTLIDVLHLEPGEARQIAGALSQQELDSLNAALRARLGGGQRER